MKVMHRFFQLAVVLFLFNTLIGCATSPTANLPDKKKTQLELYLTATEADDLLKKDGENVLFVDVRTRAELVKRGMPTHVDAHIPYIQRDNNKKAAINDNFANDIEEQLKENGLNKQNTIILICRHGNRSAGATNKLALVGYKTVYSIVDGTEGWKDNNLPWTDKVDEGKLYF